MSFVTKATNGQVDFSSVLQAILAKAHIAHGDSHVGRKDPQLDCDS